MQQQPMQFYSSTTTTATAAAATSEGGAASGAQVMDAAMTSAVTSLMNGANGIHTMQHSVSAVATAGAALTQLHAKRKQVKNACTNCQKACKKCDDARPCPRCIKYGIGETCVNSIRKERKKGIKRGPYKRRTKEEEEEGTVSRPRKSSKQDGSSDGNQRDEQERAASGTTVATSQYEAMRPPNVPYGYPSNLNQYAQPYDAATAAAAAYGQYAAAYHNKDQMMSNPYVAIYQSMGYPVPLPANSDHHHHHPHHRDNSSEQHQQQEEEEHIKRENQDNDHDDDDENDGGRNEDGDSKQEDKDAISASACTVKEEAQEGKEQRSSTPVPSTSTSPATTSSPESAEDDDAAKLHHLQRLTELCTAALSQSNQSRAAE